ncbi:MAG: hypothetical protein OHK0015_53890 [Chloroflexi bacterium OHK40]
MPKAHTSTLSDEQIGRALRRVLVETRGYELVRLADDDEQPYAVVRQREARGRQAYTADDAVISAANLELLIGELLEEELETGRELAIDELFDDDEHGINLTGVSLGTLAAALHFAPGAPIQRELLYAVSAVATRHADEDDEDDEDDDVIQEDQPAFRAALPLHRRFPRPGFLLAEACVEHLLDAGILVPLSDSSLMLDKRFQPADSMNALRVGQALAEQALLAVVPSLFDASQTETLQRMEPHLRHVTDRALPRATTNAMGLALLCADYYATVSPDRDLLRHYMTQGCAVLDLVFAEIDPDMIPWLANDLYGLAKVSHDAGMLDTAAIGYARSFELRLQVDLDDLDLLFGSASAPLGMTSAMHWVVAELAVATALEQGDQATAQRVLRLVHEAVDGEDDPIEQWKAVYLESRLALAADKVATARGGLEAIVAWGEANADDLDYLLMTVDFLLVAWVELARLELREGGVVRAAALIAWAAGSLDNPAFQAMYPDRSSDPNDTRHRLRARLLEAQAWIAWAQGQPEAARVALQEALRLISFALGAETAEGRHLAAQHARVAAGERPQL